MGGRYHQKYKSFKWSRQNIIGSCVGYEIAQIINNWFSQSTNCSAFFAGIEQDKRKQSSQTINGLATHVKAGHEMVKQSSQNANSPALICNLQDSKKVSSGRLGQVDFCVGQVTFPTHLPDGMVCKNYAISLHHVGQSLAAYRVLWVLNLSSNGILEEFVLSSLRDTLDWTFFDT